MPPSLCIELSDDEQARLLETARRSIVIGLSAGRAPQIDVTQQPASLQMPAAVFITLTRFGELRGCVGSLQVAEPLVQAVANSAFNAAFRDRRFAPVRADELDDIRVEISVLSEMEPIKVDSRQALLAALTPGVDGLLLEDRGSRATFLPKVWDKIPAPAEFVDQLLQKAGLGAGHWSDTIHCYRYHTRSFGEK